MKDKHVFFALTIGTIVLPEFSIATVPIALTNPLMGMGTLTKLELNEVFSPG